MMPIKDLIEKCRMHCPSGVRPSAEEAMALVGEIERLRAAITNCSGSCGSALTDEQKAPVDVAEEDEPRHHPDAIYIDGQ